MENEKIMCGIYKITNNKNNKIYIGQTINFQRRISEYKNRKASEEKSSNYKIMQVIEKYGIESFIFEFMFKCNPYELDAWELYFIKKYKSYDPLYGYNSFHLNETGKLTMNSITRQKMSESHKGLIESSETKKKKSIKIIAFRPEEMIFYISDSAKLFADKIGVGKDMIKNGLRNPSKIKGYRLYYFDSFRRDEIREKMYNKRVIRDKDYLSWCRYLDRKSVETIQKNFCVEYIKYEDSE